MDSLYFESQRPLFLAGSVSLICAAVFAIAAAFDGQEILGINRWIKPVKFFASIGIFVWTISFFLYHITVDETRNRQISWILIVVFVIEMIAIAGQAARGRKSHFNFDSGFDSFVYGIMGVAIGVSTLVVGYVLFLYLTRTSDLSPALTAGIRLGLGIFILGCVQGAFMAAGTGHTVGAPDGGPGLPFVNWSTTAGDLRVPHFLGLHSIQVIPLFAIVTERISPPRAVPATVLFSAIYLAVFIWTFVQAMAGRPML